MRIQFVFGPNMLILPELICVWLICNCLFPLLNVIIKIRSKFKNYSEIFVKI